MGEAYLRRYGILVTGECPEGGEHVESALGGQAATCYDEGYTIYGCSKCGKVLRTESIPITHTGIWCVIDRFEGNCQQRGYETGQYKCECGEYQSEEQTIDLGYGNHDWGDNPTYYTACSICGHHYGVADT